MIHLYFLTSIIKLKLVQMIFKIQNTGNFINLIEWEKDSEICLSRNRRFVH